MKCLFNCAFVFTLLIFFACSKTSFTTDPSALLSFSEDTIHFDTLFTQTGSVTQGFKIFNLNDRKLKLSTLKLMGGNSSLYRMNVDGLAGNSFNNIELEANDSLYVFVTVTIAPGTGSLPFLVRDSILVNYNGNNRFVQLEAFGKNARFYRNRRVTSDSTWNNDLPFVILDQLVVDSNVTLTINEGCRIYSHADAPFIINGTLKVNGGNDEAAKVIFAGDRLDEDYRDFPGSWPGLFFSASSKNNSLTNAIIKNAYQGIITVSSVGTFPKIALNRCIIDNIYDAGIISLASTIKAVNCLVSNCGSNIALGAGGFYQFDHCTVATYENLYITHKNPVLFINNFDDRNNLYPLQAVFRNCILYGEGGLAENEVVVEKKGTPAPQDFDISFTNTLYKNKTVSLDPLFINSIKNVSPQFDSINTSRRIFNFRPKPTSPAVSKGLSIPGINVDLDGKTRGTPPDIGCFEH